MKDTILKICFEILKIIIYSVLLPLLNSKISGALKMNIADFIEDLGNNIDDIFDYGSMDEPSQEKKDGEEIG